MGMVISADVTAGTGALPITISKSTINEATGVAFTTAMIGEVRYFIGLKKCPPIASAEPMTIPIDAPKNIRTTDEQQVLRKSLSLIRMPRVFKVSAYKCYRNKSATIPFYMPQNPILLSRILRIAV